MQELLLWKDVKKSGVVVASASAAWFVLASGYFPYNVFQLVSIFVLIVSAATLAWSTAAPLLKR